MDRTRPAGGHLHGGGRGNHGEQDAHAHLPIIRDSRALSHRLPQEPCRGRVEVIYQNGFHVVVTRHAHMPLPPGEIHVWFHSADVPSVVRDDLTRVLTSAELAKASRYRADADRAPLDRRARGVADSPVALFRPRCGLDPHGRAAGGRAGGSSDRPRLQRRRRGDLVALVFASGCPVGIAIKRVLPVSRPRGHRDALFSPDEQRELEASSNPEDTFFRIWTAKEALVKGTGKGLT